ncbi:hypothetical protein [Pontibacillus salipaludis]|uniref:hypothetical protein n=1 Tax=Pontibacillus salipaludis TaxID=1697394 RepID=UPI0031F055CE
MNFDKYVDAIRSLFISLFFAENADKIHQILQNSPLRDRFEWKPYGGDENNFSIFENQQAEPIAAVGEKIVNAIDSILMKMHKVNKLSGYNSNPKTMIEAVKALFGIDNIDWYDLSQSTRKRYAEMIQISLTGDRETPNVMTYDDGEGVHPDDFTDTFLSLLRGNKKSIPFVQGKYNMGSTGAVVFCGGYRYQLIASKRVDKLNNYDTNPMGFTIVRRHILTEEEEETKKSSWYEYLTIDGIIPRFEIQDLDLGLHNRNFITGSVVKLYSYALPAGSRSDATLDLWRKLNSYFYRPALPMLLIEQREGFNGNSPQKVMLGNYNRIALDSRNKVEKNLYYEAGDHQTGKLPITIHIFNKDMNTTEKREYINGQNVVFAMNGQTHAYLKSNFLSSLNLNMLKNSMLVHVDCTQLRSEYREDLFMASRDRLKKTDKVEHIKGVIGEALTTFEMIKKIEEERSRNFYRSDDSSDKLIKGIMSSKILGKELSNILQGGSSGGLEIPTSQRERRHPEQMNPKILELSRRNRRVRVPLNGSKSINFDTDIPEAFFSKDAIDLNEEFQESFTFNPKDIINGQFSIKISPIEGKVSVGQLYNMIIYISINNTVLKSSCDIEVTEPTNPQKNTSQGKGKKNLRSSPSLPIPTKVHYEDWNGEWNGEDVIKLQVKTEENTQILEGVMINMDANVIHNYINKHNVKTKKQLTMVKNKFFLNVFMHTVFLFGIFLKRLEEGEISEELDDVLPKILKYYSGFLLSYDSNPTLISNLGNN